MNSREYWQKREAEALKHYIRDEREYDREIKRIYQNMLDACQKEIDSFYSRYASKEGITLAEAKKRVSKLDIAAYERKAAKYVKDKDFSPKANEEMRLYNATMRINRMEMLKANIGLELIAGHDELEKFMGGILKGRTEEELKRQAGILGKTVLNNAQKANAIVNGSFHSGTFSDRIWQYQDMMRENLGTLLQQGLIQGKNPRAIAKDLKKYWYGNDPRTGGGATYCMERLMRTELARVQTEAQKQSFVRNGFKQYTFHVNTGCCSICSGLNGKHFDVEDMMPGTNAPPMHPNCRCSTSAYEDSEEYEAWLDHLANGGTTEEWNKQKKNAKEVKQTEKREADQSKQAKQSQVPITEGESDISALKARLAELDTLMEKSTDFSEMIRLQTEQDEITKKIDELVKKQSEATKKQVISAAEESIVSGGMFKKVSLSGCDTEAAKSIVAAVDKVHSKYPDLSLNRLTVSAGNMKGTVLTENDALGKTNSTAKYSGKTKTVTTSIMFNGNHFNNAAGLTRTLQNMHSAGWNPYGSIEGVVTHELGHAICDQYDISTYDITRAVMDEYGMDSRKAYGGKSKDEYDSIMHISRYGEQSSNEWFAECFADYFTQDNPKDVSKTAVKVLNRMIAKKNK